MIEPFYSSDNPAGGIDFGKDWYTALMSNLNAASDVLCLLTENSNRDLGFCSKWASQKAITEPLYIACCWVDPI